MRAMGPSFSFLLALYRGTGSIAPFACAMLPVT